MTKLASDIATLRGVLLDDAIFDDQSAALMRLLAIVEPLASLTPEQAREFASYHATKVLEYDAVDDWEKGPDTQAWCASWAAAHRIASTIFSRLGES